jgi:hypothetical protein
VRLFALDVDHKANTARFMLEARIIKSLFQRSRAWHPRRVFGSLRCSTGHFLAIIVTFSSLIFDINLAVSQLNVFLERAFQGVLPKSRSAEHCSRAKKPLKRF